MKISITICGDTDSDKGLKELLEYISNSEINITERNRNFSPLPENASNAQIAKKKHKTEQDIEAFLNILSPEKRRLYNLVNPLDVQGSIVILAGQDYGNINLLNNTRLAFYNLAKSVFKGRKFRTIKINGDLTVMRTR